MSNRFSWINPLNLKRKLASKLKKWSWRKFFRLCLLGGGIGLILLAFLFAWYAKDLPTPGKIKRIRPVEATQIFDRNGEALYAVFGEEKRITIASDQIPEMVKQATIAIEDKDFYNHHGFNIRGVLRAAWNNLKKLLHIGSSAYTQGGSTITQQYVKNALLSPEKTYDRKIKELILSIELEIIYSKDEILALYLNEIPYGSNAYGIESASLTFFGKSARDLSLSEAATLTALPQRPTYFSPYGSHTDELESRSKLVLSRMASQGYISEEQKEEATNNKVSFVPRREQIVAPHFVLYVRDLLVEKYGEQMVLEGGLKVTTTLDLKTQQAAESAIASAADKLPKYQADNAALVAVDPRNGQIAAMVGSVDYFDTEHEGNFNVTTAARQPGSSFKPIVYATAFKGEWSPSSTLWDVRTDFGKYIPQNYDGTFRGPVTIRAALANSLNIPAVKMLALSGLDDVIETAGQMGISTLTEPDKYGLSLVLGGADVKPVELAAAYGVFSAGGIYHPTAAILKVEDSKGRVLEEWRDDPKQVLSPEIAYEITHILIDNQARSPVFGSNSPLYFPGKFVAGKTGTTQEYRDAWTVGYSTQIAAAVWVGNNDYSPMNKSGGVRAASPIFNEFMNTFLDTQENEGFARPDTIKELSVDALSGKLPTDQSPQVISDIFAPWQIPTEVDDVHRIVEVNKSNGKLATSFTPPDLVEQRIYTVIHSEKPADSRWENPVIAWATENGFNLESPPTEQDDMTEDQLPSISILSPAAGSVVTGQTTLIAQPYSSLGVRSVDFYIDNISVGSLTASPWTVSYDGSQLATGNHELKVEITDIYGAKADASELFVVALDQTGPKAVTDLSAQSMGSGTGSIKLSWQNPADSDLAKIRTYRSQTSGAVGTLVAETNVSPGTVGTLNIGGLAAGTTYYFTLRPVDRSGNETQTATPVAATAQ